MYPLPISDFALAFITGFILGAFAMAMYHIIKDELKQTKKRALRRTRINNARGGYIPPPQVIRMWWE